MLYIGSDHGGVRVKKALLTLFDSLHIEYSDLSEEVNATQSVDYPIIASRVAKAVQKDKPKSAKGILICGTGTGMNIVANRFKGIRASQAYDVYSAKMARMDNDANILTLRGRNISVADILTITKVWLRTPFSTLDRHKRRIAKIDRLVTNTQTIPKKKNIEY